MMGALAFALAVVFALAFAALMAAATITLVRRRRKDLYPINVIWGVRSNRGPFSVAKIDNQIINLRHEWPDTEPFEISGLALRWVNEQFDEVEPTYDSRTATATIPYKGAEHIWETGLAHEAAHHAMGSRVDHKKTKRPDIFSDEERGSVRRAREASGMHRYPDGTSD